MLPTDSPATAELGLELALVALRTFGYLLLSGSFLGLLCAGGGIAWLCLHRRPSPSAECAEGALS
jgi:hypothetical protein